MVLFNTKNIELNAELQSDLTAIKNDNEALRCCCSWVMSGPVVKLDNAMAKSNLHYSHRPSHDIHVSINIHIDVI